MQDTRCHDFFLHPIPTLHRRYEALRAVFVDRRPLPEVARQYGYCYGSLRNLVTDFRTQCRAGQTPLFSPNLRPGDPAAPAPAVGPDNRTQRPSPTAATYRSPRGVRCAPVRPVPSCSCPCSRASASTLWSAGPATLAPT